MIYIHLFHGRKSIDEPMEDWGEDGPVFGPYPYAHVTYNSDIKLGNKDYLRIVGSDGGPADVVYYDGKYYGDWSVCSEDQLGKFNPDEITPFDAAKAVRPGDTSELVDSAPIIR